jgi:hypothetical protein
LANLEKFEDCASSVLERPDIRTVTELVRGIEQIGDIGRLMDASLA